jgi:rubrerythrin
MGFLDNVANSLNRGVNTVSRSGKTAQLSLQMADLMRQRQNLAAQLGASLYEQTRNDPALTAGREALYDGIAEIDAQRAKLEAQIEQIKAEQAAASAAAQTYRCPKCGSTVAAGDLFCSGCGLPIADVIAGQPQSAPAATPAETDTAPVAEYEQVTEPEPEAGTRSDVAPAAGGKGVHRCPKCGAEVDPTAAFCSSCGARLA